MNILSYKDSVYPDFTRKMRRRAIPTNEVRLVVADIIEQVVKDGDLALSAFAARFDRAEISPENLFITEREFEKAAATVSSATKEAVAASLANIRLFAGKSLRKDWQTINNQGAVIGERFTPFDRVGVYIPGGKAPLISTALMTAGFAQAAGVPEILAATPCGNDGAVNPALLYAMSQAGVTEAIRIGGAQAIAAMALGTEAVRPVDRIFGPGNKYVVEAKRQLVGAVSIDLLPGPSEILILADHTGNPAFIAADMLAQAEHGGDSSIGLLTTCPALLDKISTEIRKQSLTLSRTPLIEQVLAENTFLLLTENLDSAIGLINDYAPEHLSLIVDETAEVDALSQIRTAGAIYLGNLSPVAVGDFLAGPSHTLPTGGAGRSFSGLRADQFQRRTSIVRLDADSVRKSVPIVQQFAHLEGLDAHGRSAAIRLEP